MHIMIVKGLKGVPYIEKTLVKGINGLPYIDVGHFLDLDGFDRLTDELTQDFTKDIVLWKEDSWEDRTAPRKLLQDAERFPKTVKWTEKFIKNDIFEYIGRVTICYQDHNGQSFERRCLEANNSTALAEPHRTEFLYVRPNVQQKYYIWDPKTEKKIYVNAVASWWNIQDWHGINSSTSQSYGVHISGKFTDKFRKNMAVDHLNFY